MKNVLDLLDYACKKYSDNTYVSDSENILTFSELRSKAQAVGSYILAKSISNRAVAVYMQQSANSVLSMFSVIYSGNFYVVIDKDMPADRIEMIFAKVSPAMIICDASTCEKAKNFSIPYVLIDEAQKHEKNAHALQKVRESCVDTDLLYILFTSGSTGVPKGTAVCHKNVIAYTEWLCDAFSIDDKTVIGNQAPFYFSMSVSDVYGALRGGAQIQIIPKILFSFPVKLIEYMNERKINYTYWVPSAYGIVCHMKGLDVIKPSYLKTVLFAGEVMPAKYLNYWRKQIPDAVYANLFGPTETTDICCYYKVDRDIPDNSTIPIGKPCDNCRCIVVKEDGTLAEGSEVGELYVCGSFVALGYYGDKEKTDAAFVQDPTQSLYPSVMYRTGDLVRRNSFDEFEYISRKDSQIKRMGYRIEIGEIEAAVGNIDKIKVCCVIYEKACDCIALVYQGRKLAKQDIVDVIKQRLPDYMMPNMYIRVDEMPYNSNGKIDKNALLKNFETLKEGELQ